MSAKRPLATFAEARGAPAPDRPDATTVGRAALGVSGLLGLLGFSGWVALTEARDRACPVSTLSPIMSARSNGESRLPACTPGKRWIFYS